MVAAVEPQEKFQVSECGSASVCTASRTCSDLVHMAINFSGIADGWTEKDKSHYALEMCFVFDAMYLACPTLSLDYVAKLMVLAPYVDCDTFYEGLILGLPVYAVRPDMLVSYCRAADVPEQILEYVNFEEDVVS